MSTQETTDIESSDSTATDAGSTTCCDSKSDAAARDSPETRIQQAVKHLQIAQEDLRDRDDHDEVLSYHVQGAISSGRKAITVIEQREDTIGREEDRR